MNIKSLHHVVVFESDELKTRQEVLDILKEAFRLAIDDCVECADIDRENQEDPGPWLTKLERLESIRMIDD